MKKSLGISFTVVLPVLLFTLTCGGSRHFGTIHGIVGDVLVYSQAKSAWMPAKVNMRLRSGDSIRTEKESYVEICFGSSNKIKLGDSTRIYLSDTLGPDTKRYLTIFDMRGEVLSDVPDLEGSIYEVRTPTSVTTVKGTHFLVFFAPVPFVTHVNVFKGSVKVWNPFVPPLPPVVVVPGFFTTIALLHAPIEPIMLNYGQMKKYERILGPSHFKYYNKHLRLAPVPFAPVPLFPDKHFYKDVEKADKKMFKHAEKGGVFLPGPVIPVPIPIGPGSGYAGGGKGGKGNNGKKGGKKK